MDPQKINVKLNQANLDIAYAPIVQSGGTYDLKVSAASNEEKLQYDVILCSLGARYSMYCANIARTFLVDPVPKQEEEYKALLQAQEAAINALVPGAEMSAAFAAATKALEVMNCMLGAEWKHSFASALVLSSNSCSHTAPCLQHCIPVECECYAI